MALNFARVLAALWLAITLIGSTQAQTTQSAKPLPPSPTAVGRSEQSETISRLAELRRQIQTKQDALNDLKKKFRQTPVESIDPESQRLLTELPLQIRKLRKSFEQIAVSGLDMSVLAQDASQKYQWQADLLEIMRPLLGSLKELTETPRKIESLRRDIDRSGKQQKVIEQALASVSLLRDGASEQIGEDLDALSLVWQSRLEEVKNNQRVYNYQLATLQDDEASPWALAVTPVQNFLAGRGLTIGLAILAGLIVWLVTRTALSLLLRLRLRRRASADKNQNRERALRYLSRAASVMLIVCSTLLVFYLRSDMLLLALSGILLVLTASGLRHAIPRYIKEIRILLGIGSVRLNERLIVEGVPVQVRSIHTFAKLVNPLLEGELRLSLARLTDMTSRPCEVEAWFPCQKYDFLLMPDNSYAQVMRQSVEIVRLKIVGSIVEVPTAHFLKLSPANLSKEGFQLPIIFRLDYQHRSLCLDEIPRKIKAAVQTTIDGTQNADYCEDITVELKEAGVSSLDFLVRLTMSGGAAKDYPVISRTVQQSLVALCNLEDWIIPFGQLTIHQGEALEPPRPKPMNENALNLAYLRTH